MNMQEAVRSVLSQYAGFTGRARRSEYWFWYLATFIAYVIAAILDSILGINLFVIIVALAVIVPTIAVGVRRLHDTDKSGWFILIGLIPIIGTIILIVFFVQDSGPDNQYGPNPKGASGPAAPPPPAYGTPPTA
jgi:uncharacterized membrane protein YhaH (DUF805 family)